MHRVFQKSRLTVLVNAVSDELKDPSEDEKADLLLLGASVFFLTRIEERLKRRGALSALHELRSIIHVIDMHQLTKDPATLSAGFTPTARSPARITNKADLARYLDYCSEMLSITGKIAALFAQSVNDAVVVDGVNDIENLASNLSRKIWQKITLIEESH